VQGLEAVQHLGAQLDRLAAVDLDTVPTGLLGAQIADLDRAEARLAAQKARRVAAFDARGGAELDGSPTTGAWLRARTRAGHRDAATLVRTARQLRALPAVAAALAAGEVSWAHATTIAPALTDTHSRLDAAGAAAVETALTDLARDDTVDACRTAVRHLATRLDPDGTLAREERAFTRRYLTTAVGPGGLVHLRGLLDPEGGEILRTALAALTPPPVPGDDRTHAQAQADGLVDLCTGALRGDTLPTVAGRRPQVTLTVDLPTLRGEAARAGLDLPAALLIPAPDPAREPATPDPATPDAAAPAAAARGLLTGGASLPWTGPVHPATARRIACDADLTRLLLDPAGEPLHLGRTHRFATPAQRRVLDARDRGCIADGCHRPPQWCDAHHIRHWADGGHTDVDDMVLLCRYHHRHTHEAGWTITRDRHGRYRLTPPPHKTRSHRPRPHPHRQTPNRGVSAVVMTGGVPVVGAD
jgi:hypothetical protein